MGGEEVRVPVAVLVKQPRRARDVGEEECDGAAQEMLSHGGVDHPAEIGLASSPSLGSRDGMVSYASGNGLTHRQLFS